MKQEEILQYNKRCAEFLGYKNLTPDDKDFNYLHFKQFNMSNKQTAVNWLIKNLMLNGLIRLTQDQHSLYKELTKQAKAMEKEQKIDFAKLCYNEGYANIPKVYVREYYKTEDNGK